MRRRAVRIWEPVGVPAENELLKSCHGPACFYGDFLKNAASLDVAAVSATLTFSQNITQIPH